ncbi:MAG: succinylglutamate desuccinylase [Paracoccus denitrificans]|uniref:Succinylglutamate desuccinylase n=1 Tax=Paracoccus denitrificans TaxID=266 RepID=A0A533IEI1_PARDE|nr:MAG: succinylglutamate desuccinylase [Paracoccus denitrificans]
MRDTDPSSTSTAQVSQELTIYVRAGDDNDAPHRGTLQIGDWSVPCAVGRSGVVAPALKREGDGATPAGRFPLRYGFYEPDAFDDAVMAGLAFPFKPKPDSYAWIEDPESPDYNRMRALQDGEQPQARAAELFDLFVPLGWNDAVPVAAGGSAIFLHAARADMSGTAGCVAVARDQLMNLATRLRPGMVIDISSAAVAAQPLKSDETIETVTFHGLQPGPRVIVTGGVHGNEVCGPRAITRMIAELRSAQRKIRSGSVTFVPVVNGLAFRHDRREGDRNLNRSLREYPVPLANEDRVANVLCPLLRAHDVLIDLHSFASKGPPFALFGPEEGTDLEPRVNRKTEAALIQAIGLPFAVYGWMPAHLRSLNRQGRSDEIGVAIGTTEYMRHSGGAAITVECGEHKDPASVSIAYSVIVDCLTALGVIEGAPRQGSKSTRILRITDAVLAESDDDRLIANFTTGQEVKEGEIIGLRANGDPITAAHDGAIIFASGKIRAGTEMCFLCRAEPEV